MRVWFVWLSLAPALFACHESTAFINGDSLSSPAKAAGDTASCNQLEQHGPTVFLTGSHETAPQPAGGTIEDGTYVLTSSTLYTKARPHGTKLMEMGRTTMVIAGSTSQLVRTDADEHERHTTVARETAGTVTTLHTVCTERAPSKGESTATAYTATPGSFQFIQPGPAGTVVATYTKVTVDVPTPEIVAKTTNTKSEAR